MRRLIWYIRSCFCKHDWELIFDTRYEEESYGKWYDIITTKGRQKVYRCKNVVAKKDIERKI